MGLILGLAAGGIGLVVLVAMLAQGGPAQPALPRDNVHGRADAPVLVTDWSDFQ